MLSCFHFTAPFHPVDQLQLLGRILEGHREWISQLTLCDDLVQVQWYISNQTGQICPQRSFQMSLRRSGMRLTIVQQPVYAPAGELLFRTATSAPYIYMHCQELTISIGKGFFRQGHQFAI